MRTYKDIIDVNLCCLRSLAEANKKEMSVNVYNELWNLIQSIEHDLKELEEK